MIRTFPSLQRTDPERYQKQLDERRQAFDSYMKEFALYDAAAMDAVDAFRKDHDLVFEGNPRGLVDERFVQALREAYTKKEGSRRSDEPAGGSLRELVAALSFSSPRHTIPAAR